VLSPCTFFKKMTKQAFGVILFYGPLILVAGKTYSQPVISFSPLIKTIPSACLPKEVLCQKANNNLDVIIYKQRYYIAFRTAPTHFASRQTCLYVMSSADAQKWTYETKISKGCDIREPRFLILKNKLFIYYFEAGRNPLKFQPRNFCVCTLDSGKWKSTVLPDLKNFVPWNVKIHKGKAYLSAYYGKGLYKFSHQADLRLFTSEDGFHWTPLSTEPQCTYKGAEEGEFEFDKVGNLWATIRLEGEGALIAYADKDSLEKWHFTHTGNKYDSALLFAQGDEIYLISRINMDGEADQAPRWLPLWIRQKYNLVRYSLTEKKTALFRLDRTTKKMVHLFDFPSIGDNAFPRIVEYSSNSFLLFNYSSDISRKPISWLRGQLGKTFIYKTELIFTNKEPWLQQ
jgi:hypothetical protein